MTGYTNYTKYKEGARNPIDGEIISSENADGSKRQTMDAAILGFKQIAPDATDDDGIFAASTQVVGSKIQTVAGQPDIQRSLIFNGDADSATYDAVSTIIGTDNYGAVITEDITHISGNVESTLCYSAVTSVVTNLEENYLIGLDTPTGGTYLLGDGADITTTALAYNANDAAVLAALEVAYGAANVTSVSSLTVVFAVGFVATLTIDGTLLEGAGAEDITINQSAVVKVGLSVSIGLPLESADDKVLVVVFDGTNIGETVWSQSESATVQSLNFLTPGTTVSNAYNGTKSLEYFAGIRV